MIPAALLRCGVSIDANMSTQSEPCWMWMLPRNELPDDANSGGFDTAGGSLFFSSDQFEQYLKIARRALDQAIVTIDRPRLLHEKREAEIAATRAMRSRCNALKRKKQRIDAFRSRTNRRRISALSTSRV